MIYDNQLQTLQAVLPSAGNVSILLPINSNIDRLASGLALYLSLKQQGKEVSIVCEDNILVGQAHLFGIDKIQKNLAINQGGDFILSLEGVAEQGVSGGIVPSLEKLDYKVEGNNLNLVFKVVPGRSFQPTKITPHFQSGVAGSTNLIFVIGAISLKGLGSIYENNPQVIHSSHIVNIDNQQNNANFGQINIIDLSAASISEVVSSVMVGLGIQTQSDIATNLLTGIFDATLNLTSTTVSVGTYEIVAQLMKSGGQKPQAGGFNVSPTGFVQSQPQSQPSVSLTSQEASFPPLPGNSGPKFDLSALMPQSVPAQQSVAAVQDTFTVPPVVNNFSQIAPTPSQEERPYGEGVVSESEPDWLTPKIFKGTSIGETLA